MARKFENIVIGDQLELTADKGFKNYLIIHQGQGEDLDPNRVVRAAIVTHIWFDPVDKKEYIGLAYFSKGGDYGQPTEKRTITGIARCGWRPAERDWIEYLQARENGGDNVVSIFDKRVG